MRCLLDIGTVRECEVACSVVFYTSLLIGWTECQLHFFFHTNGIFFILNLSIRRLLGRVAASSLTSECRFITDNREPMEESCHRKFESPLCPVISVTCSEHLFMVCTEVSGV